MAKDFSKLAKYIPEGTYPAVEQLLLPERLFLKVKKPRQSKFGDYRYEQSKDLHYITINNDLNQYAFLITLLHEIAHLYTFREHHRKASPHGSEWKSRYSALLRQFMAGEVFPDDIQKALVIHLSSPTASTCTDMQLFKILKKYDKEGQTATVLVENIPDGKYFKWNEDRVFLKLHKIRKRYKCEEVKTRRIYFFHPLAEVEGVEQ